MAQRTIDSFRSNTSPQSRPRAVHSLGMRGGLGKTLLIAFLLLTILPLSLLAFLTYNQIQRDARQKVYTSLNTVVALKDAYLMDWVDGYERELSLLVKVLGQDSDPDAMLAAIQASDPNLTALVLRDLDTGLVLASIDGDLAESASVRHLVEGSQEWLGASDRALFTAPPEAEGTEPLLGISYAWEHWQLVGLLSWDAVRQIITAHDIQGAGVVTSLVTGDGWMLSANGLRPLSLEDGQVVSQGIASALEGKSGTGVYADLQGQPVFGAHRWNPKLGVGILAEQSQMEALAVGNTLTALVVGTTLAVALVTSALAAVVTRRVTRPIVQLTEQAAWMARGDLNQRVMVSRQDEIGVLARAFNQMAAELRVLYDNLEAKVAERTRQLEEAHERTQFYLMQLATSAEVARVATSIRDLDLLLATVVRLIGRAFELYHTAIYLLDDGGQWVVAANAPNEKGMDGEQAMLEGQGVDGPALIGSVAAGGRRQLLRADASVRPGSDAEGSVSLQPPVLCELAVPLRVQERVLGVLDLQSTRSDDFEENEQIVYQSLADQISIAIENARAYAAERETVERLRELDRIQSQFLTNMSHALRTPLNSVIGFSRILLKELDGPLNETQRADLDAIYESGRQLLGLLNDMLELSRLQIGIVPFSPSEVDLAETIEGVMATARALARGKPVQLYEQVPADLPLLFTDGQRVRQVILALLSNAVKFTDQGSIHLSVAVDDGCVIISVQDTGKGIPREELERIFSDARCGEANDGEGVPGFGLAISRRVVERLGGRIWVESVKDTGSTFTFTLPVGSADPEAENGVKTDVVEG